MIRVLVVDDHPVVREGLAAMLSREPDIDVIGEARDGQEAVEVAARERPMLILLDVAMPRLDGIDACRQIRSDPATRDTPIVMLTAHAGYEDEARAGEAGADRYLTKPFSPLDLLRLVDELPSFARR